MRFDPGEMCPPNHPGSASARIATIDLGKRAERFVNVVTPAHFAPTNCRAALDKISAPKAVEAPLDPPGAARVRAADARRAFRPISRRTGSNLFSDALVSRVAVTRRKVVALNDTSFAAQRRVLATKAQVAEADIHWIGLFRSVPIAAAARLEVDERSGTLLIYLLEKMPAPLCAVLARLSAISPWAGICSPAP